MTKTKSKPKPLFDVKGDFYESLDNFVQEAMNLNSVVKILLSIGAVPGAGGDRLRERVEAFERALDGGTEKVDD